MPLATEEEWESDPELRAMRQEFVASFITRKQALDGLLPILKSHPAGNHEFEQALIGVVAVAHKLSGAAETYGFPTLTRASAAFEDWFHLVAPERRDARSAITAVELLGEMLDKAHSAVKDPVEFVSDPRLKMLESAVKAASPGPAG